LAPAQVADLQDAKHVSQAETKLEQFTEQISEVRGGARRVQRPQSQRTARGDEFSNLKQTKLNLAGATRMRIVILASMLPRGEG
jgi:hypothetical protein